MLCTRWTQRAIRRVPLTASALQPSRRSRRTSRPSSTRQAAQALQQLPARSCLQVHMMSTISCMAPQVEIWEKQLLALGKACGSNMLKGAKRTINRDFKLELKVRMQGTGTIAQLSQPCSKAPCDGRVACGAALALGNRSRSMTSRRWRLLRSRLRSPRHEARRGRRRMEAQEGARRRR